MLRILSALPLQFVTSQPPLEPGLQWDFLQPIRREIEIGESAATATENQSLMLDKGSNWTDSTGNKSKKNS